MSEFVRAKAKYEKKETPKKRLGSDALISITLHTDDGTQTVRLRVIGFTGNTMAGQRGGKGLEDKLVQAIQHGFGGRVKVE